MLRAFPDAYHILRHNERGPRGGKYIQSKKENTLKEGGDLSLYDPSYDMVFQWYPYLFLNRSKPETHMSAFSQIEDTTIVDNMPGELKELIIYVARKLNLLNGEI